MHDLPHYSYSTSNILSFPSNILSFQAPPNFFHLPFKSQAVGDFFKEHSSISSFLESFTELLHVKRFVFRYLLLKPISLVSHEIIAGFAQKCLECFHLYSSIKKNLKYNYLETIIVFIIIFILLIFMIFLHIPLVPKYWFLKDKKKIFLKSGAHIYVMLEYDIRFHKMRKGGTSFWSEELFSRRLENSSCRFEDSLWGTEATSKDHRAWGL